MTPTATETHTAPQPSAMAQAMSALVERLCSACDESSQQAAKLAMLLTHHALERGHVCLPLREAPTLARDIDLSKHHGCTHFLHDIDAWQNALFLAQPALSTNPECTPLVYDPATQCLYLQRYYVYEQRLAKALHERLRNDSEPQSAESTPLAQHLSKDQHAAVAGALNSNLTLISGGPGTGKTTTVACYLIAELTRTNKPLSIALAAPTGKAAARMEQSLKTQIQAQPLIEAQAQALARIKASTLHRLLGSRLHSPDFKHNQNNPLPHDLLILDEASMIDLPLMSKLFDALKPEARILLLGDASQLASVSAGSVFSDLTLPASENPLKTHIYELHTNFRFAEDSSIHSFCNAVKQGDSDHALTCLSQPADGALHWATNNEATCNAATAPANYAALTNAKTPEEALEALKERIILAAVREGSYGVTQLNRQMRSRLNLPEGVCSRLPIIIKANDAQAELYNGDTGVLFEDPDTGTLKAWFTGTDDIPRSFSLAQLPFWQEAFALTIHESQGSEHEHVTVILPHLDLPHMTRELLYTAVSRARKTASLLASRETLHKMITRRCLRASGLLNTLIQLKGSTRPSR